MTGILTTTTAPLAPSRHYARRSNFKPNQATIADASGDVGRISQNNFDNGSLTMATEQQKRESEQLTARLNYELWTITRATSLATPTPTKAAAAGVGVGVGVGTTSSNAWLQLQLASMTVATATATVTAAAATSSPPTQWPALSEVSAELYAVNANLSTLLNLTQSLTTTATGTVTVTSSALPALADVDSYLMGMAWPKALCVALFLFLILLTVIGNTLVILAVLTTRRLRTVTNCFVMNLAITDWLVGTCVMPPAVILYIVGSWRFGWILCDIWISLDVLLCTGSILSLCAISLDRYLAVTQPLTYSKKRRSKRLALFMILIVWVTALSITCPPYLGWYEPGRRQADNVICRYNQNKGYVVFSAMGSFFIPLAVMLYVYLKIGYVLTSRRQRIVRDAYTERTADNDIDCDNFLSESEQIHCATPKFPSFKTRWSSGKVETTSSKQSSLKCSKCSGSLKHQASFYELVEISRLSSLIHCTAIGCKYGSVSAGGTGSLSCMHGTSIAASNLPRHLLQHNDSHASFTESCITMPGTTGGGAVATPASAGAYHAHQHQHPHPHHQPSMHPTHHHTHHGHHGHHAPHRIPMRISTTKRDTKTAKTLTIVMGGFIACWLPFFVYYLLIPFLPSAYVFEGLMSFLTWVGWVNCAINPFIYAFYNPDFRTAFWRLTCRRVCKQKPPAHHMAMFRG